MTRWVFQQVQDEERYHKVWFELFRQDWKKALRLARRF